MSGERTDGLPSKGQLVLKRGFDLLVSVVGLLITGPIVILAILAMRIETGESGLFVQERIGRGGAIFRIMKVRTMRSTSDASTFITTKDDPRITRLGRLLRTLRIDELPQLWNVLRGDMSMVGPRPDMPGYADALPGQERLMLHVRPGITGPATLKYRKEEEILATQDDPDWYNDHVIFPDKVRINNEYVRSYSFARDLRYLAATLIPGFTPGWDTD